MKKFISEGGSILSKKARTDEAKETDCNKGEWKRKERDVNRS